MRWILLCSLLLTPGLMAAESVGKPRGLQGGADAAKADARRTFQEQAQGSDAVKPYGKGPVVTGLFLWNGRADENYKPFYQWELRLTGGSTTARDLRLRVLTLSPTMQVMQTGPWKNAGSVGSGRSLDLDYRLNCPAPAAYRVEATWEGGNESFLGWDRVMIPVAEGAQAQAPFLACVAGNAEYEAKTGTTTATWSLWNIGGQPVPTGATVTIRFLTDQGQVSHSEVWKQPANEVIAAHSAKERRVTIRKKLPTDVLSFQAQSPNANRLSAPVSAEALEASRVEQQGDRMAVHLRNTGKETLTNLTVTLTLLDAQGAKVATVTLPATTLAPGAQANLTAPVAKGISWQTYELGWSQGGPGR